jgi:hypothetical protein
MKRHAVVWIINFVEKFHCSNAFGEWQLFVVLGAFDKQSKILGKGICCSMAIKNLYNRFLLYES